MELAILGIIIDIFGLISTAMGWALQKKAHNDIRDTDVSYLTVKKWWVGMALVLLAQPLYLGAITMTKISILGVLGPIGILASIVLARVFLKEEIRIIEYIAMILFVPGSIITLWFSTLENHRYNKEEFNNLFYSQISLTYLFVNFVLLVILMWICRTILRLNPGNADVPYTEQIDEFIQRLPTGVPNPQWKDSFKTSTTASGNLHTIFSVDKVTTRPLFTDIEEDIASKRGFLANPRLRFLPLIVYPYFGPFVSGLSITFARVLAGFVSTAPPEGHTSNFDTFEPWLYMICVPVGATFSYYLVNEALKHYATIYVVPLFKISDLMHHILSGAIFLKEFHDYTHKELCMFMIGVGIWATGVALLLLSNDKNEREKLNNKEPTPAKNGVMSLFSSKVELRRDFCTN